MLIERWIIAALGHHRFFSVIDANKAVRELLERVKDVYKRQVPKLLVPDNTKTGVNKACRYDPELNPTYQEMALHYGVGVVPARPYKPRDKAKVESGVLLIERWIIAALRHHRFFSVIDANKAVRELLERVNQKPCLLYTS